MAPKTRTGEALSAKIRSLREDQGWTLAELGVRLGVSAATVFRWENQTTWPGAKDLERLAGVAGVEPWELLKPSGAHDPGRVWGVDPKVRRAVETVCEALGLKASIP